MDRRNAKMLLIVGTCAFAATVGTRIYLGGAVPSPDTVHAQGTDQTSLLGRLIYGEARGEPYVGQVAVGAVVVNRTSNPAFPKTIAGVIFQPGAFDAVSDGQIWSGLDSQNLQAAQAAVAGWDPSGGSLYYWNPATATSPWIWSRRIVARIGKHFFGI